MTIYLRSCLFVHYFRSPKKDLPWIRPIWFIQHAYTQTQIKVTVKFQSQSEGVRVKPTEMTTIQLLTACICFRDVKILTVTSPSQCISLQAYEKLEKEKKKSYYKSQC